MRPTHWVVCFYTQRPTIHLFWGMLSPLTLLLAIAFYFGLISLFAWLSQRRRADTESDYFLAGRKAPWLMVAIGMVGSSLSGLTFLSIPGKVQASGMTYMQIVLGYLAGYVVIAHVLLPLYYRLRLTSIYSYLGQRFGRSSYLTGAAYFLLSRSLGSSVRLYLAVTVLQAVIFERMGVPYWVTATLTVAFILAYTFRGGLQTVLFTDVLQTLVMLTALLLALAALTEHFTLSETIDRIQASPMGRWWEWDPASPAFFWRQFLAGVFITIVMTGLDQDMMQKNLSIPTLRQAQKNVYLYSILIVLVNILFLSLGVLMYEYASATGWQGAPAGDTFFPLLALDQLGTVASLAMVLGLIAAAMNSADGTLTALTTSTCLDLLRTDRLPQARARGTRHSIHLLWAVLFLVFMMLFRVLSGGKISAIDLALTLAGYTYGPLLGLFAFGMFTKRLVKDKWVPLLCIATPLLCLLLQIYSPEYLGYTFGFELLLVNGGLTVLGLWALSVNNEPRRVVSE